MNAKKMINNAKAIIEKYSQKNIDLPKNLQSDDVYLYPRLFRAVYNQATDGSATFGRYGIFMETIVGYINESMKFIDHENNPEAIQILIRASDALAAFSEIQIKVFDPHLRDKN